MQTVLVQTRVESNLKKEADEVLSSIGMDMTSAIRLFLTQVVNCRKIPFQLVSKQERVDDVTRFIAAEPAATYGAVSTRISTDRIEKVVGTKKGGNWSKLVGIVQLTEDDIKNDERLAYLLSK